MEGLQGFILGGLIFSVLWLTVLIFMVGKAYRDGHTDGQQSYIDREQYED